MEYDLLQLAQCSAHRASGLQPVDTDHGMPEGARVWLVPGHAELSAEWADIRASLKDRDEPRAFIDKWLEERGRAFAIETGQIEGLYTLKAGITEQLIAEGLEGVVHSHTVGRRLVRNAAMPPAGASWVRWRYDGRFMPREEQ